MSHDAGFQLFFNKAYTLEEIITNLFEAGWNPNDYGKISICLKDDIGDYFWHDTELVENNKVFVSLYDKFKRKDLVGLVLMWKNSNIGISVLLDNSNSVLVSTQINRKTLKDSRFSDVNWYINRILTPLEAKLKVEGLSWNEHV